MSDLATALDENRAEVRGMIDAIANVSDRWLTPRAPGKWSPSQVVEHVARALEESANEVAGRPAKFPVLPRFLRPVVRGLLFRRILRTGEFGKAKTNKAMDPATGSPTPAEGRQRLETALAEFERECRARGATSSTVASCIFGRVDLGDYVRFQRFHTRHHATQIARAPKA
jgi:hypothetical protein